MKILPAPISTNSLEGFGVSAPPVPGPIATSLVYSENVGVQLVSEMFTQYLRFLPQNYLPYFVTQSIRQKSSAHR